MFEVLGLIGGMTLVLTGIYTLFVNHNESEEERIEKAYRKMELERKKQLIEPIKNSDINLFGSCDIKHNTILTKQERKIKK